MSTDHVFVWLLLGYLNAHPDAKDTIEGIRQWWLPPGDAALNTNALQAAIDYLVEHGWMAVAETASSVKVYGINKQKLAEIRAFF